MKKDQFVLHHDYIPNKKVYTFSSRPQLDDMQSILLVMAAAAVIQKENLNHVRFKLLHSLYRTVHKMTEF